MIGKMYVVIGTENCGKCGWIKKKLEQENISYIYKRFQDLSEEEQDRYLNVAECNSIMSFPLVINESGNIAKEIQRWV